MNKGKLLLVSTLALAAVGLTVGHMSNFPGVLPVQATECQHKSYNHYDRVEPTCTEPGSIEYWICCVCHQSYSDKDFTQLIENTGAGITSPSDGRYIAPRHTFEGAYEVTKQPTTLETGVATRTCTQGDAVEEKVILQLPSISFSGVTLSWNAVEGAEGYKILRNGMPQDIGNVTSYVITTSDLEFDTFAVRAYTTAETHYEYGETSVHLAPSLDDLHASKNGDFELRDITIPAYVNWYPGSPYGNFTDRDWWIASEADGNMAAKMTLNSGFCNSDAEVWTIGVHKDIHANMQAEGTYKMVFDYKLSPAAAAVASTRTIFSNINHPDGFAPVEGLWLDGKEADVWYHAELSVTKPATAWQQWVLFYHTNTKAAPADDDYVLIDNIQVYRDGETTNIDLLGDGTFQCYQTLGITTAADIGQWRYGDTLLIEGDAVGTGIIREANGNQALKVYSTNDSAAFNLSGNPSMLVQGLYIVQLDVKLGPNSGLDNLGMRAWAPSGQAIDNTQFPTHTLVKGEYTTVRAAVITHGSGDWINLQFWAFGHNTSADPDNYILIDNVQVYKVGL